MKKRKTSENAAQLNEGKNNKVQSNESSASFPGKLYWNGTAEHVLITENKQRIMVQGIDVEAQVLSDGNLKLEHYEKVNDRDEKHKEAILNIDNELEHRQKELAYQKEIQNEMNARIESGELSEKELETVFRQKNDIERIMWLHATNIKKLLLKVSVGVHYQVHVSGLSCTLAVGKLLEVLFLPKPVCWVPVDVSLNVSYEVSNSPTENKFEQLPYGLGEVECHWFEKHRNALSNEEKVAKVVEYRLRAEAGNAYGQSLLGTCYLYGNGVTMDEKRAAELFMLSAEQGNAWGQFNLGDCFQYGHGVVVDEKKAVELYTLSAEQGNVWGQFRLGVCFEQGNGVAMDRKRAVELYTLSAEQGNAWGQYNLGECFLYGYGVAVDLSLARQWYGRAAAQGHRGAINNLKKPYDELGQKH